MSHQHSQFLYNKEFLDNKHAHDVHTAFLLKLLDEKGSVTEIYVNSLQHHVSYMTLTDELSKLGILQMRKWKRT